MNRKRPWHQRLVRKVTRLAPAQAVLASSPLSLLSGFNAASCLIALLSGAYAVGAVLAASSVASWAIQFRNQARHLI